MGWPCVSRAALVDWSFMVVMTVRVLVRVRRRPTRPTLCQFLSKRCHTYPTPSALFLLLIIMLCGL